MRALLLCAQLVLACYTVQFLIDIPIDGYGSHMNRLEVLLADAVTSSDPNLSDVATHLIRAGGKRIRPTLSIAAAASGGAEINNAVLLSGVAVELVHLASLYHDDVMDEASTRRSAPSVNAKWGNLLAIVAGDFLLARAAGIAARLGQDVAELLADTLANLCEGQILEVNMSFNTDRTQTQYLAAISGKTASLMATSCRIGAMASNLNESLAMKLERIGYLFGMVYQIRDDVLDVVGTNDQLGKVPAQDLIEGVYTLPTILALSHSPDASPLKSLLALNRSDGLTQSDVEIAQREILVSGALESSVGVARGYCDEAADLAAEIDNPIARYLGNLSPKLLDGIDAIIEARLNSEIAS